MYIIFVCPLVNKHNRLDCWVFLWYEHFEYVWLLAELNVCLFMCSCSGFLSLVVSLLLWMYFARVCLFVSSMTELLLPMKMCWATWTSCLLPSSPWNVCSRSSPLECWWVRKRISRISYWHLSWTVNKMLVASLRLKWSRLDQSVKYCRNSSMQPNKAGQSLTDRAPLNFVIGVVVLMLASQRQSKRPTSQIHKHQQGLCK